MDVNPVGVVVDKSILIGTIQEILDSWKLIKPSPSWWGTVKGNWVKAVGYIITSTDYFIRQVDTIIESGPNKKALVIDALTTVYDSIVPELLPIWLKPFGGAIKNFVLNVVVSFLIDFIVDKYRNGSWNQEVKSEVELPA